MSMAPPSIATARVRRHHPRHRLWLAGVRTRLRAADFGLYGAAGIECRVPVAQSGMGAERRATGLAVRRRRVDGRPADFSIVVVCGSLGRVKSLTLMAVLWSIATLLCAAAASYAQMLVGRMLVGVGEAAYGSVGIALVISVFPSRMRATLSAAFMAGGLFGQVLGVAIGGEIAAKLWLARGLYGDWHCRSGAGDSVSAGGQGKAKIAAFPHQAHQGQTQWSGLRSNRYSPAVRSNWLMSASGLQLFSAGALPAWLPTYLGRYHAMSVSEAGRMSALLFLACGAGMILCGMASDRVARDRADRKILLAIGYCLGAALALSAAMLCAPGSGATGALGDCDVSGCRNDWPRRRDGRQSDARCHPRHRLCHTDTGQ